MPWGQVPGHCGGPLARLKAREPPWVLTAGAANIRSDLRPPPACHGEPLLNTVREPPKVLTTGATNNVQAGLSRWHSASGPRKAATGAARQTAPSRPDPTECQRGEDSITKRRLGTVTRGNHEVETDNSAANASR